jgi:hypothetical protein
VYDIAAPGPGTGVFTRAGSQIASAAQGTIATVRVTISGYAGVWVPQVGDLTGITYTGGRAKALADTTYYNAVTRTALATSGLADGDGYQFETLLSSAPPQSELLAGTIANVSLPSAPGAMLPLSLGARAAQFIGSQTDPVRKLFALRDGLVASGVFSDGLANQPASRPGHSTERIDQLLGDDEMICDDEQFAVALALLANKVGIPARVVVGFYPQAGMWTSGQPYVVTGSDIHAWVEVPFTSYGWVPIDVIPDADDQAQTQPKTDQVPKPPVIEEPEPPKEPAKEAASKIEEQKKDQIGGNTYNWGQAVAVLVAVVVPLVLVVGPLLAILMYKARRYGRRRTDGRPADRVSGGWREVIDTAMDLGAAVPAGATRREGAGLIDQAFGTAFMATLAYQADARVFGAGEPTADEIDAFWRDVDAALGDMRQAVPLRNRIRAKLSLRSILHRPVLRPLRMRSAVPQRAGMPAYGGASMQGKQRGKQ